MICQHCEQQVDITKPDLNWILECECAKVEHPWIERAVQDHIRAANKAGRVTWAKDYRTPLTVKLKRRFANFFCGQEKEQQP